jgi:hypothetical protein
MFQAPIGYSCGFRNLGNLAMTHLNETRSTIALDRSMNIKFLSFG